MRILVNSLSVRNPSGRHVLLGHLRQVAGWTCDEHTFLFLHDRDQTDLMDGLPVNVQPMCVPHSLTSWFRRTVWETTVLPRRLKQWQANLVFTTSGTVLSRCHLPQVSLVQNPWCLVRTVHRGWRQKPKAALQRIAYRQTLRRAAFICCNSRHMQQLFLENGGRSVDASTRIVYQAVDDDVHQAGTAATKKEPGLILSVSVMAAWKGADVLVQALAVLHRRGCRARLRLVGPWWDRGYESEIRQRVAAEGLNEYVTITGEVSRAELHRHYAEARVYCLMSQCESFGIPAVEAQTFGTPVVGSSTCAMPEVCGAGGVYCSPTDPLQTAELLGRLLEDNQHWSTLSDHARQNAAGYRWETCSRPLLEVFSMCQV